VPITLVEVGQMMFELVAAKDKAEQAKDKAEQQVKLMTDQLKTAERALHEATTKLKELQDGNGP